MKKYIQPEVKAYEIEFEGVCQSFSDTQKVKIWTSSELSDYKEGDTDAGGALSGSYRSNLWN